MQSSCVTGSGCRSAARGHRTTSAASSMSRALKPPVWPGIMARPRPWGHHPLPHPRCVAFCSAESTAPTRGSRPLPLPSDQRSSPPSGTSGERLQPGAPGRPVSSRVPADCKPPPPAAERTPGRAAPRHDLGSAAGTGVQDRRHRVRLRRGAGAEPCQPDGPGCAGSHPHRPPRRRAARACARPATGGGLALV